MTKIEEFIFYYGVMGSSKTARALIERYALMEKEQRVLLLKPAIDDRYSQGIVRSRIEGLWAPAQEFEPDDDLTKRFEKMISKVQTIIIDEAQFLSPDQVNQLKEVSAHLHKVVNAYGLKVNFKGTMFPGSQRLLEVCTEDVHIKTPCSNKRCNNIAIINTRYDKTTGEIFYEGPEILIGGNDSYMPLCWGCWKKGYIPRVLEEMEKEKRLEKLRDKIS